MAYRNKPRHHKDGAGLSLFGINAAWFGDQVADTGTYDPFKAVDEFIIDDFAQKAAYMKGYGKGSNWLEVAETMSFFIPGSWIEAGAERLVATRGAQYFLARATAAIAKLNVGNVLRSAFRFIAGPAVEAFEWLARKCLGCMSGDSVVWTPDGTQRLDQIRLGKLVDTAGDQMANPDTGEKGDYGLDRVADLCASMVGKTYCQVHARIDRPDGSSTDIYELLSVEDIRNLGYYNMVGSSSRMWIPLGATGSRRDHSTCNWLQVMSIGPEVTLGDGIDIPTLKAAPVTAIFVTTESTLLSFQFENVKDSIFMTATHPVWNAQKKEWMLAGQLVSGDLVGTSSGEKKIECIEIARRGAIVYNLKLAAGHTFFVGLEKAWVHNTPCDMHHALPKFLGGATDGLTVAMDWVLHQHYFHPQLNDRLKAATIWYADHGYSNWASYLRENPAAREEAVRILMTLSREFETKWGDLMDGSLTQAIWRQMWGQGGVMAC